MAARKKKYYPFAKKYNGWSNNFLKIQISTEISAMEIYWSITRIKQKKKLMKGISASPETLQKTKSDNVHFFISCLSNWTEIKQRTFFKMDREQRQFQPLRSTQEHPFQVQRKQIYNSVLSQNALLFSIHLFYFQRTVTRKENTHASSHTRASFCVCSLGEWIRKTASKNHGTIYRQRKPSRQREQSRVRRSKVVLKWK